MKTIRIDGVIGDIFNTAEDIRLQIEMLDLAPEDTLEVKINSGGGSVFEGFAIYNLLRTLPNKVITRGEGLIGSIATLILLAAEPENTFISEVSMWMIHRALVSTGGNQEELIKQAEILKTIDETLISVYSERTGIDRETIEQMMSTETWLSGKEAVSKGFIGTLENPIPAQAVANALNNQNAKQMSLTNLFKGFRNETDEEEEKRKQEEARVSALTEEEKEEEMRVSNLTDEEKEEEEKAKALALTEEEEKEKEAQANTPTMAMFQELAAATGKIAQAVDSIMENQMTPETMKAQFSNLVGGLKKSTGSPIVGESKKHGYVDPQAKHRAAMKDIEAKTRNI